MGFILHAHPIHGESHIQHNVNREVATTSPFHNEPHGSHILFVKAASGMIFTSWAQHHQKPWAASAQSFTLWQQAIIEITWRDHSGIACSCHIYCTSIWVLFFTHIPFVVNRTFNATSTKMLQQYTWISAWSLSH